LSPALGALGALGCCGDGDVGCNQYGRDKGKELHVIFVIFVAMLRFACRCDCSRLDFVSTSRNSKWFEVSLQKNSQGVSWMVDVIHRHFALPAWTKPPSNLSKHRSELQIVRKA
jgi:hypothetical protein